MADVMIVSFLCILTLIPPLSANSCGSTIPIEANTIADVNFVGPKTCDLTFATSEGASFECLSKVAADVSSSDDHCFLITSGSIIERSYCGSQNFTYSTVSSRFTLSFKATLHARYALMCNLQPLQLSTILPTTVNPPPTGHPTANAECSCGRVFSQRVINGSDSTQSHTPWQALISMADERNSLHTQCGGTLISQDFVLTAAHCVEKMYMATITLGDRSQSGIDTYEKTFESTQFLKHSQWNSATKENDIALIKLPSPVVYSAGIQPACLPFKLVNTDLVGKEVSITGWGMATSDAIGPSDILQNATMTVISNSRCSSFFNVSSSMICTERPGIGACHGDSGGPLTLIEPTVNGKLKPAYVVGVVSFGSPSKCASMPSVFTRVTSFINWITSTTGEDFCNK